MKGAKLHLPAFTQGKPQPSAKDVHDTRGIANVRIHVDHVLGHVRRKYKILSGTLPVDYLSKRCSEQLPLIDVIVPLCCAFSNLSESVVPFELGDFTVHLFHPLH